jgi:putative acyl-CoA dehydrogenase
VPSELAGSRGADRRLDARIGALERGWRSEGGSPDDREATARRLVERLALALQGALLVRHAPVAVADAFCATRLAGDGGAAFGTLPAGLDLAGILARAAPETGA